MDFVTQFRRVLISAFLVLALAAAASAFAVGFTGGLTASLSDPQSAQGLRLAALQKLEDGLGYTGYLKSYREYLTAGASASEAELRRYAQDADASLSAFLAASLTEAGRDRAAALRGAEAPFRRIALAGPGAPGTKIAGLAPLSELERAYAALKEETAKARAEADRDRIDRLSGAFVWAQVTSVVALWLFTGVLFALAWYLHEHLVNPVEKLRSSINAAAAGAIRETVWGIGREDDIGGIARAAERLRQAALTAARDGTAKTSALLADGAEKLEDDLVKVAGAALQAQSRIEAASARATKASEEAVEAAELAREGSARFAERAEQALEHSSAQTNAVLGALMAAVNKLSEAAKRAGKVPSDSPQPGAPGPLASHLLKGAERFAPPGPARDSNDRVVEDLIADLEALERFARERKQIAGDKAVAMTASLIEAIDRLNAVADRIGTRATDTGKLRAAG